MANVRVVAKFAETCSAVLGSIWEPRQIQPDNFLSELGPDLHFFSVGLPFVIPNICFSNDFGGVSVSAPETVDPVMRAIRRIPQSSDPGVVSSPPCLRFLQTSLRLVTASVTFFMCLPRPVRGLRSWAAGNGLVVMKTLTVVIDPNFVS